jgi:hypothetical protein
VEVESASLQDTPKGYRTVPIGCRSFMIVWVRTRHDCLMLSFLAISVEQFMQPKSSAHQERDNVTSAGYPGPGNFLSI